MAPATGWQLLKESAVYGVGLASTALVNLILLPLYTRRLEPDEFGQLSLFLALVALVTLTSTLGLDNAVARWFNAQEASRASIFTTALAAELVAFTFVGALLVSVAGKVLEGGLAATAATALLAGSQLVNGFVLNWLRLQRRVRVASACAAAQALAAGSVTTIAVLTSADPTVAVVLAAQASVSLGTALLYLGFSRRWFSIRHLDIRLLRAFLAYGVPIFPAGVAGWTLNLVDRYILEALSSTAEVGLYFAGYQMALLIALLTTAFQQAWAPFAFSISGREEARAFYAQVLLYYLAAAALLGLLASIAAVEASWLLGPEYQEAVDVVPLLIMGHLLLGLTYVAAIGLNLAKRGAPIAVAYCVGAVANVLLNLLLIPDYGRVGAAAATALSWALVVPLIYRAAQKSYPVPLKVVRATALASLGFIAISVPGAVSGQGTAVRVGSYVGASAILLVLVPLLVTSRAAVRRGSPGTPGP